MESEDVLPNDNKGPMLLGIVWSLWALTTIIYIIRLCARPSRKFDFTAAEYTITAALVSAPAKPNLLTGLETIPPFIGT